MKKRVKKAVTKRRVAKAARSSSVGTVDLIDALPISVAVRDTAGRFVQVNSTWEQYFGISRKDAIGKRFSELPGWKKNPELVRVAREAEKIDREMIARGPDAPPMLFEDSRLGRSYLLGRRLLTDSAGRVAGIVATGIDTTEQRAVKEALELERQRLGLVVDATRAGIVDWDIRLGATWWSRRMKRLLGYAKDADTTAWRFHDFVHPDDVGRVRELFVAELKGGGAAGVRLHE